MLRRMAAAIICLAGGLAAAAPVAVPAKDAALIQAMIDAARPGAVIEPPAGRYIGHLAIDKRVTLDGHGEVTLDGGGEGTVVLVHADGVSLMNLHITGTGANHDSEDAAVRILGNDNVVRDTTIDDSLFGIDLHQADHNIVRRNRITSKRLDLGMRGDSIRLWYSNDNVVDQNVVKDSRDFVMWYAQRNRISNNTSTEGRYGLHFMFGRDNIIEGNTLYRNSVGISMMYDEGDIIRHNTIGHSVGSTGTCISMKEASAITIEDNEIQYCASGMAFDVTPFQPGSVNRISRNRVAFNDIAISFIADWHDNVFKDNDFKGNMTEVAVYGGGGASHNTWEGNSWDSYEGFDRDHDGFGDTPFTLYSYAGRVWMDVPPTRFFKGTPLLEVIDFLDRLAPFSQPVVMLVDAKPRFAERSP